MGFVSPVSWVLWGVHLLNILMLCSVPQSQSGMPGKPKHQNSKKKPKSQAPTSKFVCVFDYLLIIYSLVCSLHLFVCIRSRNNTLITAHFTFLSSSRGGRPSFSLLCDFVSSFVTTLRRCISRLALAALFKSSIPFTIRYIKNCFRFGWCFLEHSFFLQWLPSVVCGFVWDTLHHSLSAPALFAHSLHLNLNHYLM